MSEFDKYCAELLGEKSVVVKKRSFYPRKITKAGGLSEEFTQALRAEMNRLQEIDPTIGFREVVKALKFDLGQH